MTFPEAMEVMQYDGKKICRDCWKDGTYLYIPSGKPKTCLMLSKVRDDGERRAYFVYQLTADNIFAEDWRVVDE